MPGASAFKSAGWVLSFRAHDVCLISGICLEHVPSRMLKVKFACAANASTLFPCVHLIISHIRCFWRVFRQGHPLAIKDQTMSVPSHMTAIAIRAPGGPEVLVPE